ncbi:hypothetical protein MUO69_05020, partial [Candidatus Bathyarchaeota archaeon]|nr:hypothetical protein [Candidatus Bathyarchaeota archaeon]
MIKVALSQPATSNSLSNTWLHDMLKATKLDATENLTVTTRASKSSQCVICKGSRNLCGKLRCPIMVKVNHYLKSISLMNSEDIAGASPPSVFIGRIGYPNVYAGPLVPPVQEDTTIFDLPEYWFGRSMDEIVSFRSMLVRGKHRVNVHEFANAGKIVEKTRELALAVSPVDIELFLKNKPRGNIFMDDEVQPFGPSAQIRDLNLGNTHWDHHVEKAYSDTD